MDFQKTILQKEIELRDRASEKAVKDLEERQKKETAIFEKGAALQERIVSTVMKTVERIGTKAIDADTRRRSRQLEERHKAELISDEAFESEKQALSDDTEKQKAGLAARLRGEQLAAGEAELERLRHEQKLTAEQRKTAIEHGETEKADKLLTHLNELTSTEIEEKGSLLSTIGADLQDNLTNNVQQPVPGRRRSGQGSVPELHAGAGRSIEAAGFGKDHRGIAGEHFRACRHSRAAGVLRGKADHRRDHQRSPGPGLQLTDELLHWRPGGSSNARLGGRCKPVATGQ